MRKAVFKNRKPSSLKRNMFTVWDRKNGNNIIGMVSNNTAGVGEEGGASPVAAMRWH